MAKKFNKMITHHSFQIELACLVGIEKSILLQRIYMFVEYHEQIEENYYEDKFWMYDTSKSLSLVYPYMSMTSIRRWLQELEKDEWLITGNFNKAKYDKTKWYGLGPTFIAFLDEKSLDQNGQGLNGKALTKMVNRVTKMVNQIDQNGQPIPIISNIGSSVVGEQPPQQPIIFKIPEKAKSIEEVINRFYRHYFNKANPNPMAETGAVYKMLNELAEKNVPGEDIFAILAQAFERCVQENKCSTYELLNRIKWKTTDYFSGLEKKLAAERKKDTASAASSIPGNIYNPETDGKLFDLGKMFQDIAKKQSDEKLIAHAEGEFNIEVRSAPN